MTIGQFKKSAGPAAKAPPARKSRWSGVKAAQPRDPMPHAGEYRFRYKGCEEGHNPGKGTSSFKIHLEIVEQAANQTMHADGDAVQAIFLLSNAAGMSRAKAFAMALTGHDSDEAYDAFDPAGEFLDAMLGYANSRSDEAAALVDTLIDACVTRGKDTGDGDYYREYEWAHVAGQGE